MIRELIIKKLFGQFNYHIKFKSTGITIITGPNGFGKSTILKIISTFAEKDLYELSQFNFEEMEMVLSGNKRLRIAKKSNSLYVQDCQLSLFSRRIIENWRRRHGVPFIERVGPDTYIDMRFDKVITLDEYKELLKQENTSRELKDRLIAINYEQAKKDKKETAKFRALEQEIDQFRSSIGKIKFIKEQRLLRQETIEEESMYSREKRTTAVEVIKELPSKIREEIKTAVLQYSEISSKLDSTYPSRLFSSKKEIGKDEFWEIFSEIIRKQEMITDYGLIKEIKINGPVSFREEYSIALRVYLDDTLKKLSVFDDIVEKLDLFVNIVNSKLSFKKLVISNDVGIKIIREDNEELDLAKLSSGEQQIIVLYYDLIFGVQDKVILMIDEPEISLHVAWQRELMNDFNRIIEIKNNKLNVIIATHSPQVINNNWNNIIDLGEQHAK